MLCRLLAQDFDLKPALFFDFPKQRLFGIFVKFNMASQRKPLVELRMINQQDTVPVYHKRHDRKINQFMNVGHGDSSHCIRRSQLHPSGQEVSYVAPLLTCAPAHPANAR